MASLWVLSEADKQGFEGIKIIWATKAGNTGKKVVTG